MKIMEKKYKYTEKCSILAALGFRKPNITFSRILVNFIPAIAVGIIDFLIVKNKIIPSEVLCNSNIFECILFSVFAYVVFCYIEYFFISLFADFLLIILDVVAKVKQRYLPITMKDLEMNNIDTVDKYLDYIGNILQIKGIVFPIINEETRKQCENVFIKKFSNQLKDSSCIFKNTLRKMSETSGYDSLMQNFNTEKYIPWIIDILRDCL